MLRLVHPAPAGQGTGAPKGRRFSPCFSLTADERRHLAAALHNLRRVFGTWACLADAMGTKMNVLSRAARERNPIGSPALALRAARIGGMSMEAVLSGTLSAAGRCESCGSRLGHGVTARAAGGASWSGPSSRAMVDWTDPTDIRLWIAAIRVQVQDLVAAGDDATRHPKRRILSRAESRRRVLLADHAAEALLAAGEKSLTIAP